MISYPLRAARWSPLVILAAVAASYLAARPRTDHNPAAAVDTMRVITLLLTLGCCAALDDPATPTLAACPTRLWRRRATQAGVTLIPAAGLWLVALAITVPGSGAFPAAGGLVLEAAVCLAFVLTTAVVAQRFGLPEPGLVVGAMVFAAGIALLDVPPVARLFIAAGDPEWPEAHQHWGAVLAALVLIAATALRDPAARRLHRLGSIRVAVSGRAEPAGRR